MIMHGESAAGELDERTASQRVPEERSGRPGLLSAWQKAHQAYGGGRGTGATTARYAVLNLIRWSVLAGMLVFFLSAILALHEALNFQDRVLELAGNDRDRAHRVLGVLHDTLENPENYPEDRELPYASIAVRLDRLSKVQASLTGFHVPSQDPPDQKDKRPDDTTTLAAADGQPMAAGNDSSGENVVATATPIDQWKAASNRLELSIADLDDALKAGDPARRLVEAFVSTREHIDTLGKFTGSVETTEGDIQSVSFGEALAADDDQLANDIEQFKLQQVQEDLADGLVKLEARMTTSPDDELLIAHLERLKHDTGRLDIFFGSKDLNIEEKTDDASKTNWPPIKDMVERIDHRISAIESVLLEIDDGFVAAKGLADLINQARKFSDHLQDLPTEGVTLQTKLGGKEIDGTEAVVTFETIRGELSDAIQQMENQLSRRTRVMVVADQLAELEGEGEQGRRSRALAILREFDSVGRFEATLMPFRSFAETPVLRSLSGFGFDPQRISTLSHETLALLFVFVIGAIGSVIFITKDSIQMVLEGNWLTDKPKRSLAWYIFRPVFGVIVALAAFLLFKAGQLAMGNSGLVDGSQEFNLPILSVIALFAGLLSWQALEVIETRGATWFRAQKRQYLWATGLENKLRMEQHSPEELASSVGRSVDQVFRWLVFRDRVSPEMQDRIADWLETPYSQLFRNEQPQRKPLWLRVAPEDGGGVERQAFEQKLSGEQFHADKLAAWLTRSSPVPAKEQDRILLAMDRPMPSIFTDQKPEPMKS